MKIVIIFIVAIIIGIIIYQFKFHKVQKATDNGSNFNDLSSIINSPNPLTIESLKSGKYLGSDLKIEETLSPGSNYSRYVASYLSEGNKIFGLLTIPNVDMPKGGFPIIIFNHGFIPPQQYVTTERYVAYQDGFARDGYITFKSDYRGHGNSEGQPIGAYGSNAYTIDVLNGLASVKKLKQASKTQIGMWGHSMGGFITLRAMVVDPEIKAGVIWGGVVGDYNDLLNNWRRPGIRPFTPPPGTRINWRSELQKTYGTPQSNPTFWHSISANYYLKDLNGPIQLHHGGADDEVPVEFSEKLYSELKDAGVYTELYTYLGEDHNISSNFNLAEQRSVDFFDKYLK